MSNKQQKPNGQKNFSGPDPEGRNTGNGSFAGSVYSDNASGPSGAEAGNFAAASDISLASSVAGAPCPSMVGVENVEKTEETNQVLAELTRKLQGFTMETLSNTSLIVHRGSQTDFTDLLIHSSMEGTEAGPYIDQRNGGQSDPRNKGGKGDATDPEM